MNRENAGALGAFVAARTIQYYVTNQTTSQNAGALVPTRTGCVPKQLRSLARDSERWPGEDLPGYGKSSDYQALRHETWVPGVVDVGVGDSVNT
jgi:hypothetical protein